MEMGGVQDYADYMNQYARSSVSWSFMDLQKNLFTRVKPSKCYMDTLICPTQILRWISMNVTHAMNLRSAILHITTYVWLSLWFMQLIMIFPILPLGLPLFSQFDARRLASGFLQTALKRRTLAGVFLFIFSTRSLGRCATLWIFIDIHALCIVYII